MWSGVEPALHAAGLRTIAPDQRGYSPGARPAGVEAYSMHRVVADALGLLDAYGLARAHVLGHDWGAAVGWNLAGRHPDRVATLTAVSVPHPAAHAAALRDDADQQRRSGYIAVLRRPDAEDLLLAEAPAGCGRCRAGAGRRLRPAAHRAGGADRPAELVPGDVPARPRRARPGHGADDVRLGHARTSRSAARRPRTAPPTSPRTTGSSSCPG